jgi:hypothetical protein
VTEFGIGESGVIALRPAPRAQADLFEKASSSNTQHPVSSDEYQASGISKPRFPKPLNFEP